jgi:hypothetical protein
VLIITFLFFHRFPFITHILTPEQYYGNVYMTLMNKNVLPHPSTVPAQASPPLAETTSSLGPVRVDPHAEMGRWQEQTSAQLVDHLRDEIRWGDGAGRAQTAYYVGRALADRTLPNPARAFVNSLEHWSVPLETSYGEVIVPGSGGSYAEDKRHLNIGEKGLEDLATVIEHTAEKAGVRFPSPNDAKVLSLVALGAHEGAHALLVGISGALSIRTGQRDPFHASGTYTTHHPEQGLTGNFESDKRINEERFAASYQLLAAKECLAAMGIQGRGASRILKSLVNTQSILLGEAGASQIDHLHSASHETAPEELAARGEKARYGMLGYSIPLTEKEIIQELTFLGEASQTAPLPARPDSKEDYFNTARDQRLRRVARHLSGLQKARLDTLDPKRVERRANRKLAALGIVGAAALSFTGYEIGAATASHESRPIPPAAVDPSETPHSTLHVATPEELAATPEPNTATSIPTFDNIPNLRVAPSSRAKSRQ